jgi:hypothetical protein
MIFHHFSTILQLCPDVNFILKNYFFSESNLVNTPRGPPHPGGAGRSPFTPGGPHPGFPPTGMPPMRMPFMPGQPDPNQQQVTPQQQTASQADKLKRVMLL